MESPALVRASGFACTPLATRMARRMVVVMAANSRRPQGGRGPRWVVSGRLSGSYISTGCWYGHAQRNRQIGRHRRTDRSIFFVLTRSYTNNKVQLENHLLCFSQLDLKHNRRLSNCFVTFVAYAWWVHGIRTQPNFHPVNLAIRPWIPGMKPTTRLSSSVLQVSSFTQVS